MLTPEQTSDRRRLAALALSPDYLAHGWPAEFRRPCALLVTLGVALEWPHVLLSWAGELRWPRQVDGLVCQGIEGLAVLRIPYADALLACDPLPERTYAIREERGCLVSSTS
jgi:hypothetical protein